MTYTTLNRIREHNPCQDGWEKLLKHLGKTKADDEPLSFETILESNGLDEALWCLRSLDETYYPKIRLMAADFAERVLHIYEKSYPTDNRPRLAIKAARDYANGLITDQQRIAAHAVAHAAANAAADKASANAALATAHAAHAANAAAIAANAAAIAANAVTNAARAAAHAANADNAERKIQAELLLQYFGAQ